MYRYMFLFIIYILGWKPLTEKLNSENIKSKKYSVVIFPHTSYWDFIIFLIYKFAYPDVLNEIITIIRPESFKRWGWILKKINALPATTISNNNTINNIQTSKDDNINIKIYNGFVEKTTKYLIENYKNGALIMMAPDGQRGYGPWRNGFYYLAKNLNASLRVVALDYTHHYVYISDEYDTDIYTKEVLYELLQKDYKKSVPLYPEFKYYKCEIYNKHLISIYDPLVLTSYFAFFLPTIYILYNNLYKYYTLIPTIILSSLSSAYYHYKNEESGRLTDVVCFFINLLNIFYHFIDQYKLFISLPSLLWILLILSTYSIGSCRHLYHQRTFNYIFHHTLFHSSCILFSLYILSLC